MWIIRYVLGSKVGLCLDAAAYWENVERASKLRSRAHERVELFRGVQSKYALLRWKWSIRPLWAWFPQCHWAAKPPNFCLFAHWSSSWLSRTNHDSYSYFAILSLREAGSRRLVCLAILNIFFTLFVRVHSTVSYVISSVFSFSYYLSTTRNLYLMPLAPPTNIVSITEPANTNDPPSLHDIAQAQRYVANLLGTSEWKY